MSELCPETAQPIRRATVKGIMSNRTVLAAALAAALTPTAATAAPNTGAGALRDCVRDGDLDRVYSPVALRRGLKAMPVDVARYSNCDQLLRAAFAAGPSIRVRHRRGTMRMRCSKARYEARLAVRGSRIATFKVRPCKRVTRVVRFRVTAFGQSSARKRRVAKVTLRPGANQLRFLVRLRARR
jgi:hypothetical protein